MPTPYNVIGLQTFHILKNVKQWTCMVAGWGWGDNLYTCLPTLWSDGKETLLGVFIFIGTIRIREKCATAEMVPTLLFHDYRYPSIHAYVLHWVYIKSKELRDHKNRIYQSQKSQPAYCYVLRPLYCMHVLYKRTNAHQYNFSLILIHISI